MDKDQILQMSRNENKGKPDEWEQSVVEQAAQLGKSVGLFVCILVVLLADFVLQNRDLGRGAWLVFLPWKAAAICTNTLRRRSVPS